MNYRYWAQDEHSQDSDKKFCFIELFGYRVHLQRLQYLYQDGKCYFKNWELSVRHIKSNQIVRNYRWGRDKCPRRTSI